MKAWKLLLALCVLALLAGTLSGCLFGGSSKDKGDEGAAAGPKAGGPPGMPGEAGPAAGGPPGMPGEAGADPMAGGAPGAMPGGPEGMPGPEGTATAAPSTGGGNAAALALKHEGKYDAAASEYGKIIAANPDDEDANWGMAWILAEQGEKDAAKRSKAVDHFNKFVSVSSDTAKIAEAEAALGRIKE